MKRFRTQPGASARLRRVLLRMVVGVAIVLAASAYGQPPSSKPDAGRKPSSSTRRPRSPRRSAVRRPTPPPKRPSTRPARVEKDEAGKEERSGAADTDDSPGFSGPPSKTNILESVLGDVDDEEFLKPPEERTYSFSIKDGTYAELLEGFSRATGLGIIGDPPDGTVTFVSTEKMDFKTAFNRVRMLLFKHPQQYWLLRSPDGFEILRMTEGPRKGLPLESIFISLDEYLAADLDDNELALLLYTPPSGSIADLQPIRDFMPDYVRIARYSDTNSMTIFALVKDINKYLDLIDKFATAGDDPRVMEKIEVHHVPASQVLTRLKQLVAGFEEAPSSRRRGGARGQIAEATAWGINAFADDESRCIIVKAVPDKITEIKEMLPWIDFKRSEELEPVVIRVRHLPVGHLLNIINPILTGTSPASATKSRSKTRRATRAAPQLKTRDLTIIPQPASNTLIVLASEEKLQRVQQLVAQFDVPQAEFHRRVVLDHANAETLASRVREIDQARAKAAGMVGASTLTITPDPAANAVILVGTEREIEEALVLIEEFDVEPADGKPTLHRARLKNAKPSLVATMLQAVDQQSAPAPAPTPKKGGRRSSPRRRAATGERFRGDDATRILYVFCTDREWDEQYWPLIQDFDKDAVPAFDVESIPVVHADSSDVVTWVNEMLAAAGKGDAVGLQARPGEILVINGSPEMVEEVRKLVAQFDVDPNEGIERRTFTLEYAEVSEVMGIIQSLILTDSQPARPKRPARGGKTTPAVTPVRTDEVRMAPMGRNLIVWAPPRKMSEIATLIEELDSPLDENELRVYEFARGTDVRELAQQLNALFPQGAVAGARQRGRRRTPQPTGGQVQFVPQPSANKILVSAPTALFPDIEEAIEKLRPGQDLSPGVQVAFFNLEHADPESVATLLEPYLRMKYAELVAGGAIQAGPKGKTAAGMTILVEPDARSGRLMVAGPALLQPEAEALISELDRPGDGERIIRTVTLEKTDPQKMAETIRAMLTGKKPAPTPRRTKGGKVRRLAPGEPTEVTVLPAPGGSAVVLAGYVRDVEEVEGWITMLDQGAAGSKILKVYRFARSDVESFADAVMTLVDSGGGTGKPKPKGDEFFASYGGPRRGKDVSLVTDVFGGTMLATTTPAKMREIDELHELYEGSDETEAVVGGEHGKPYMTYPLKHADAYDAVFILESVLDALWPSEDKPEVDYIPFSDILVVKGKPDDFPEVQKLITDLVDKPSPEERGEDIAVYPVGGIGMTASELALLLKTRMPSVAVDIAPMNPQDIPAESLIERVTPTTPAISDTTDEAASNGVPCVVPLSLVRAIEAAALTAVTGEQKKAKKDQASSAEKEEPAGEPPSKNDILGAIIGRGTAEGEEAELRRIRIEVDDATGVLMFRGAPKDIADAKYLLEKIEEELKKLPQKPDIRVYRIKHVDVRIAGQILEAMFNQPRQRITPQQRAAQQRAARQAQQRKGQPQPGQPQEGQKGQRGAPGQPPQPPQPVPQQPQTGGVRVFPDTRTRTLIIRAATEDFPAIVELLATIDKPGDKLTHFKIIELKKLNAAEVEQMLKDLLGIGRRTARAPRAPRAGVSPAQAAAAAQQMQQQIMQFQMAGLGEAAINIAEEVKIASNPATNSILVMGPREAITLVEEFVAKLESQEAPEREVRTYVLKFADATEVAPQLEKLFKAAGRRPGKQGEGFNPIEINAPTLVVDARRNALIVNALTIDFPKIEPLIEELDTPGGLDEKVMEFPLQFADAAKLAKTLNNIYGDQGRGRGKPSTKKVQIVGDPDTNTVFVSAPPELRGEITERITNAEAKGAAESKPKVIKLKEAVPSAVAQKLREAFGQDRRGRGRITITGDDATKQLFVKAPEELMPEIESLVALLDQPSQDIGIRIFKLKYARAPEVLEQMNTMVRGLLGQLRGSSVKLDVFSATADARSNSLVVMGGPTTFRLVEQVLENIDQPAAAPVALVTMVYALQRARAGDVARSINNLFRGRKDGIDPPRAEPNASTNTILVRGTEEQCKEIEEKIIKPLDEFAQAPTVPLIEKVIQLEHMKADEAATTLSQWFRDRQNAYKNANIQTINPAELTVSITPLVGSNQIAIMASENNMKRIEERLADLDVEGVGAMSARGTEIYPMKYVDPNQAAGAINSAFRKPGRVAEKDQVTTSVVGATQSVVVTASEENQEKIRELLAQMDVDTGQGKTRKTYKMKFARASDVAATVNQTLGATRRRTRQGELPVTVTPNDTLNVLILSGPAAEIEEVEALVAELDREPSELTGRVVEVYTLKYADPGSTISTINNAFPRVRGQRPEDVVSVAYAWGTSALVVNASRDNQKKVKELLEKVDVEGTTRTTRLIELKEANSDEAAQRLTQLFRQTVRTRRGDTQMQILSDPRTNTLLVFANEEEFQQVKALVETLDVPAKVETERALKVYPVKYADPNGIVNAINQTYRAVGRVSPRDQVTAIAEWGTQSVIVSASPKNHEKVQALIAEIDVESTLTRQTRVIKLEHANAEDIARTLGAAYRGRRSTRRGAQPVTITADQGTNSLIVYASEKEMAELQPLIESLDVKPEMERYRVFKTFKLTYGEAWGVVQMINMTFRSGSRNPRDQVTAAADWGSNSILVSASPENMKRVEEIIAEVDRKDASQRTVRVIEVEHADPAAVERALGRVFAARGRRGQQTVSISHTQGTNTLLIKANDTEFEEIQTVLKQLDTVEAELGEIRTFALQYTDAAEMKDILETYLQRPGGRRGRGGGQLIGDVRISTSGLTNSLIVSGDKEQVDRLADVIARIDVEVTDAGTAPKILKLQYAVPSVIEPTLSKMFVEADRGRGRGRGRGASPASMVPVIVAEDASKSLIVRANPVDFTQIKELVAMLDTEDAAAEGGIKIIQLRSGVDVEEMADKLQSLLDDTARFEAEQRGRGAKPARVAIRADRRTNSLLVAGARSRFTEVEELVRRLENLGPLGGTSTVILRLKNLDPEEIKRVIEPLTEEDRRKSGTQRGGRRSRGTRRR